MTKSVGNSIKAARLRQGWTQTQLAEQVGVAQEHISMLESDVRMPSTSLLVALATTLGVTTDDLVMPGDCVTAK